jgi:hypothetical protein
MPDRLRAENPLFQDDGSCRIVAPSAVLDDVVIPKERGIREEEFDAFT